jgi:hypothetical protein
MGPRTRPSEPVPVDTADVGEDPGRDRVANS